jgi:hypothetical protein
MSTHEEQPPAAARAGRFTAKNAPAGQRQIRATSVDIEMITSLRQPPPAAPAKTASGGLGSARPVALSSFTSIVRLRCFRRFGLGVA